MAKKNISITIDPTLYQEVLDTAKAADQSVSSIITDMIEVSMRGTYESYPLFIAIKGQVTIDHMSSLELDLVGSYPTNLSGAFYPEPTLVAQYGVVAMPRMLVQVPGETIRVKFFNMTAKDVTIDTDLPVGEIIPLGVDSF